VADLAAGVLVLGDLELQRVDPILLEQGVDLCLEAVVALP
jgi:hypothetical protein